MSIYQGQITGSLKVQSSLTGLLYATSGVVSAVALGSANGVATLDSNGRLPISQLSTSAMEIKGDWDASLNSPSLANGTGNMGDVYRCSVAGSVNFGAGSVTFIVGDLVYYTGSIWQIVANSFSLTTSGASGSASLTGRTLNIPTYTLTGLGGVASTRSLTINGTAYDLSADRSWNIPSSPQARTVTTQTATLNQQVFTVSYTSGQIDVYYNGSYLAPSDYTATNGTSVTLAFQCKANDVLVFAAYTNTLTIGGSGVSNYMAKWNSSSLLTSSTILYDTGSLLFVNKSTDNSSGAVLQVNGYITQSTLSAILKADSSGKIIAATSGTDYLAPSALSSYVPYTGASTNLNLGSNSLTTNSIQANSIATPSSSEGLLWYDSTQKAFAYYNDITNNILHIGQEVQLKVYNNTGSTIAKGAPVYITSTSSGFTYPNVALAIANNIVTGNVIGLANQAIPNATAGYVTLSGLITGVNTGTYTVGDVLYLSPYSAGQYMNTVPPTGYISRIGMVSYVSSSNGTIYVNQTYASPSNPITGTGTTNTLPKFTGSSTIGNSNITDSGTLISLGSNTYVNGALGIGIQAGTNNTLRVEKNLTSNTTAYGIFNSNTVQSDVTAAVYNYISSLKTQAATFTLANYYHYGATVGTIGAGSSVTSQYGFYVASNLTGATNNYGFYGNLAAATNTWNLYMSGTASNYMAGSLGIGTTTTVTNTSLVIGGADTQAVRISSATAPASYYTDLINYYSSTKAFEIISGGTSIFRASQNGTLSIAIGSASGINYEQSATNGWFRWYSVSTTKMELTSSGTLNVYGTITPTSALARGIYNNPTFLASANGDTLVSLDINPTFTNGAFTGVNNYALRLNTASATNAWNIYASGTANNYMAGALGIGSTDLTGYNLHISKNQTGAVTAYGIMQDGVVLSDVTTIAYLNRTLAQTQAATFTLPNLTHYFASQGTFGTGSTVTNQTGFHVSGTLSGATTNYGFRGQIASSASNWNLYMDGTASNYMAGSLGIGSTSLTGITLRLAKNITGATTSYGILQNGQVQSDAINVYGFLNSASTQATTFTTYYTHYGATQSTIGAGSTMSNQVGFYADSNMIGATNNYAFFGNIPAQTNAWNIYMGGTASNYLAGALGIGSTSLTGYGLRNTKNITGATLSIAYSADGTVQSDVTSTAQGYRSVIATQATAFTLTNLQHFVAGQGTFGAGSTVTNQYAFYADAGLISGTNNYGFYSAMTISGTSRWSLYMAGTAPNYIAGALGIGSNSINASAALQVTSTTQGFLPPVMTTTQKNGISSPATGLIVFDSTLGKLCVFSTTWQTISSL